MTMPSSDPLHQAPEKAEGAADLLQIGVEAGADDEGVDAEDEDSEMEDEERVGAALEDALAGEGEIFEIPGEDVHAVFEAAGFFAGGDGADFEVADVGA